MKYVSIDIETTGLNPQTDQILSVALIIEDTSLNLPFTEIPKRVFYVRRERIEGSAFAVNMNIGIIQKILSDGDFELEEHEMFIDEENLIAYIRQFIYDNVGYETFTVAGKNFATFDKLFLDELCKRYNENLNYHRRILDPSIFYLEKDNDEFLPDLTVCKLRAGVEGIVTHDALFDAWDVVQLLRNKL